MFLDGAMIQAKAKCELSLNSYRLAQPGFDFWYRTQRLQDAMPTKHTQLSWTVTHASLTPTKSFINIQLQLSE